MKLNIAIFCLKSSFFFFYLRVFFIFYVFNFFFFGCWVFVAARGLSLVVVSGATLHCGMWASVVVAHGLQ